MIEQVIGNGCTCGCLCAADYSLAPVKPKRRLINGQLYELTLCNHLASCPLNGTGCAGSKSCKDTRRMTPQILEFD